MCQIFSKHFSLTYSLNSINNPEFEILLLPFSGGETKANEVFDFRSYIKGQNQDITSTTVPIAPILYFLLLDEQCML